MNIILFEPFMAMDINLQQSNRKKLMKAIRLNKYLSEVGVCSRREADRLVEQGAIKVNGTLAIMGMKVLPDDVIEIHGKLIAKQEQPILLAFHKPQGIVSTCASFPGQNSIIDYLNLPYRVYPIGRLDKDSEGLILLTNQGELANAISKSRNNHEKEYIVQVNRYITNDFIKGMSKGVPILDTVTKPCKVKKINDRTFSIILTQGLNRQIRRMCEYFEYRVVRLQRIRIMNIRLNHLKSGAYRLVTGEEYEQLVQLVNGK